MEDFFSRLFGEVLVVDVRLLVLVLVGEALVLEFLLQLLEVVRI